MIKRLKALLVGVTEYRLPEKAHYADPEFEPKLPGAALDVLAMTDLVERLGKKRYDDVEVLPLFEPEDTRKKSIMLGLDWLCQGAAAGDQLVFYFSGHSRLSLDPSGTYLDQMLMPADYDWKPQSKYRITDEEMMRNVAPLVGVAEALKRGACIEIVLETCAASRSLPIDKKARPFGCFFGGPEFPSRSGAVWAASLHDEHSHWGRVPSPCPPAATLRTREVEVRAPAATIQGLFTYFFCKRFFAHKGVRIRNTAQPVNGRHYILEAVTKDLAAYRKAFNQCCRKSAPSMEPQIPSLYTGLGLSTAGNAKSTYLGQPMVADCPGETVKKAFSKPPNPCPPPATVKL